MQQGKVIPYRLGQALKAPGGWGSQIFTQPTHEGDNAVSSTHRPPLPPRRCFWYSLLLQTEPTPGPQWAGIGNRTCDLPACSAVPQPAANNGYFTWSPIYIFDHTSLISCQNEKCFTRSCRENQNTHFTFNFFLQSGRLWDNVEKYSYCTAKQATQDNMAHAHSLLDN